MKSIQSIIDDCVTEKKRQLSISKAAYRITPDSYRIIQEYCLDKGKVTENNDFVIIDFDTVEHMPIRKWTWWDNLKAEIKDFIEWSLRA